MRPRRPVAEPPRLPASETRARAGGVYVEPRRGVGVARGPPCLPRPSSAGSQGAVVARADGLRAGLPPPVSQLPGHRGGAARGPPRRPRDRSASRGPPLRPRPLEGEGREVDVGRSGGEWGGETACGGVCMCARVRGRVCVCVWDSPTLDSRLYAKERASSVSRSCFGSLVRPRGNQRRKSS